MTWEVFFPAFLGGGALGFFLPQLLLKRKYRLLQKEAQRMIEEAQAERREIILQAKEEAMRIKSQAEAELREARANLARQQQRLDQRLESLDRKFQALEAREQKLKQRGREIEELREEVERIKEEQVRRLEQISGLTTAEAKELLLKEVEEEARLIFNERIKQIEAEAREQAMQRSRDILLSVIQRCAVDVISESTVTVIPLPNDEMKGRLIGREGRNIRALENATGVDIIIDDTPEVVSISCFDPLRREIARIAIEKLIQDGRIHPARIEEMVEKAKAEVEADIIAAGERALEEVGVSGIHPELVRLLGKLKYRTSYAQNVLKHSIEVAIIAGLLAGEIGADVDVCKKAGLLHDIGKALDHEVQGTHAKLGADLVQRFGGSPKVVHAIAAHHGEVEPVTAEDFIVATADAISSSRPGARRESVEQYLKRVEALERIATSFPNVEKAFAIQAGREVRVLVKSHMVDDLGVLRLARDIARKIEETLEYPGQIKVTVIREVRVEEYAR